MKHNIIIAIILIIAALGMLFFILAGPPLQ